ncbi:GNAT family N-acetyltransferase [Mycolicibacterium cosmeticum]|uniref:Acetyltransferase n=1 Tax=Mycolicibacterium cosmeticum TaxID=258533 RepID=W9BGQ1_MYCCO|nr:GNAT family N-acetyltransferase [Mycolicibacterium cosmeticum]TLH72589.1 GNAT family N-acetyltransferase [Mycolicibacterium cosmeticum]CDO05710.1 putative acetyltransferase [Mycolicibacterium cosmeticum]
MPEIELRFTGAEALDALEPLWLTLHHHHTQVATAAVFQDDATSWAARRAAYRRWLAEDDSFIVLAERDGTPVGYAMVEILPGPDDTWVTGRRMADVQTLAVAPAERGHGIGTRLLDAVDARLAELGIGDVFIAVLTGNADAQRFYERRGLRPVMTHLARFAVDR